MNKITLDEKEIAEAIKNYVKDKYGQSVLTMLLYKQDEIFRGERIKLDRADIVMRRK